MSELSSRTPPRLTPSEGRPRLVSAVGTGPVYGLGLRGQVGSIEELGGGLAVRSNTRQRGESSREHPLALTAILEVGPSSVGIAEATHVGGVPFWDGGASRDVEPESLRRSEARADNRAGASAKHVKSQDWPTVRRGRVS